VLTLARTSRTPSVSRVLPLNPPRGFQFLRSKQTSFSQEFENPKACIQVCHNGCEKVWTNWQSRTDLTWFTNSVLATSTGRREKSFYWCGNTEIRIIYIYRKELTLTQTSRTPLVSRALSPNPRHSCQFLRSKRASFSPEFENPKALIPVCYNGCEKAWTNRQTCADLTWFTNSVLGTSIGRGEELFYWYGNTEIRIIYIGKG